MIHAVHLNDDQTNYLHADDFYCEYGLITFVRYETEPIDFQTVASWPVDLVEWIAVDPDGRGRISLSTL